MKRNARPKRYAVLAVAISLVAFSSVLVQCSKRTGTGAATPPSARSAGQGPRQLYSQTVVVPAGAKPTLAQAGRDLVAYLSKATGAPFRQQTKADHGIFLVRSDSADAPPDLVKALHGLGREPYAIRSTGDGKLTIVANADDGLVFGAYQYLESLGLRFYYPNERWTIVPHVDDIERRVDRLVRPAFRLRQFVGTGGLGKGLAVDPQGELALRWETWKRRNGFGEEFHIDGHSGEAFNVRNKDELLAHPEFLANVGGHRVAWSKIAKLDPTSSGAVNLYVQDRLEAYRAKKARDPDGPGSFAVSVEPADGGGHCDSKDCEDLGSISDREFHVANAVARALTKDFPGAKASLFAYNLHADVPKIAIDPNVYVTLVPYAFQRNGADPQEFISSWAKKKSPLSIYDYWSIPDWVADLPGFDYREIPAQKLRFWHEQHIEGFLSESTYSAGAMGLAWYIAGHLMWDLNADPNQLANAFFNDAFASAAPAMRRMLERWASGFYLNSLELRASFADLRDAFAHTRDPAVRARITDYAGYVEYLRLRHEWQSASLAEKPEKKRALLIHLWRLHSSAMVDTFRLQQLLLRKDTELGPTLDPTKADLPIWKTLAPVTGADAQGWVNGGLSAYADLGVQPHKYGGELVAAPAPPAVATLSIAPIPLTLVGSNQVELTIDRDATVLSLQLTTDSGVHLRLSKAGSAVASADLAANKQPQTFTSPALAPGTYRLDLRTTKVGVTSTTFPGDIGVQLDEFRTPKAVAIPDLYFFVPAGQTAVAVYDPIALPAGSGAVLRDASGAEAPLERLDGGRLLIARVPPEQRGRIWTLRRAVAPDASLRLLNVPQRLALSPQALRIPKDALTETAQPPHK